MWWEYTNGAVGNSMMVDEAFMVFARREEFGWLSGGEDDWVPRTDVVSFLCCWWCGSPLRRPVTRARSSVVAADSFGICTFVEGVLDGLAGFDDRDPDDSSVLAGRAGADGCVSEGMVVVVLVVCGVP